MKCQSCGAIVAATAESCEFCGTSLKNEGKTAPSTNQSAPVKVSSNSRNKPIGFAEDSFNLINELKETEKNSFNWLAFFFPIAYLAGYGGKESAKKIAAVVLIPVFLMSIIRYFSFNLSSTVALASFVWTVYVYFLVSTRQERMVKKDKPFDMGSAIVYQIIFAVAYVILEGL